MLNTRTPTSLSVEKTKERKLFIKFFKKNDREEVSQFP